MLALENQPTYEDKVRIFKNLDPLVRKNNITDSLARRCVDFFQNENYGPNTDER